MAVYTVDKPNIDLNSADCLALKAALEAVPITGVDSNNLALTKVDVTALKAALDGNASRLDCANLNLLQAELDAIATAVA